MMHLNSKKLSGTDESVPPQPTTYTKYGKYLNTQCRVADSNAGERPDHPLRIRLGT